MADDKILQHSHYKEEPVPRLEEARLSYPQWLTKMHQIYWGKEPPEVPASITTSVDAFVNAGRWLWQCVACNNATVCEVGQPSICVECATQGWVNVVFPSNREDVETELLKQPGHRAHAPVRQWNPGWTMDKLEARTTRAQAAVDAGVPFPTSLSIGATRVWSVGEILTAANKNTYERTVLEDLAGRNGPVEYEDAIVIDSLTTTERDAITLTGTGGLGASGNGLVIYNSTKNVFERYENGAWREFTDLANLTIASAAQGDVFIRGATAIQRLGAGTARQIFRTGGTGADPLWEDLLGTRIANTTTQGSAIYEDSNGRIARLAPPTAPGAVFETGGSDANPTWGPKGTHYDVFSTAGSFTWTPKAGARFIYVETIGGGGGGGSGARRSSNLTTSGGGGGGKGGAWARSGVQFQLLELPATISGTVGAGGTGGAAKTTGGVAGNVGTAGGATSFGNVGDRWYLNAAGGAAGAAGPYGPTTAAAGAAGSAPILSGATARAANGGNGGDAASLSAGSIGTSFNGGNGSAGTGGATGGAGGTSTTPTGGNGGTDADGAGGSGGGGWGSAISLTNGGNGGNGGFRGSGGGGGGATSKGSTPGNSGTGGNGAAGEVRIWSW